MKATPQSETLKQISHLAACLKAPRVTESAARLADHARDAGWTHEDYLAAVLEREVAGGEQDSVSCSAGCDSQRGEAAYQVLPETSLLRRTAASRQAGMLENLLEGAERAGALSGGPSRSPRHSV